MFRWRVSNGIIAPRESTPRRRNGPTASVGVTYEIREIPARSLEAGGLSVGEV